jgi:hydrogenase-4 component F
MIPALILLPVLAGFAAFFVRAAVLRRGLLVLTALAHAGLTAAAWVRRPGPALGDWLFLDAPGLLFLSITSALFLATAIYAIGYLRAEVGRAATDLEEGFLFDNAPEAIFVGCLLLFLGAMTLVTVSQHFGLLWITIEATTLASAPLIYFHRHHRSLEATWKYLLICSVGIALALLGNFFLGVAATQQGQPALSLELDVLTENAARLQVPWLKAAFILLLVGYGTKMGLAPLHTWLPDAHSESPSIVSALLSGALLNCAFLGILRAQQVCAAAGQAPFGQEMLVGLGLVSMTVAAVFILGQTDYKRLLAYSSVEHMGILALGVGIGGAAAFGAMLHAEPFANQGDALPRRGEHPRRVSKQDHRSSARGVARGAGHRRAMVNGLPGHYGFAAVRPVPERVHDSQGRLRARPQRGGRALSGAAGADFHWHGRGILGHGPGRAPEDRVGLSAAQHVAHGRTARGPRDVRAGARTLCAGVP